MDPVKVIEIKKSVFDDNNADAQKLRNELKHKGVYLLNLMSSPGSGKTTAGRKKPEGRGEPPYGTGKTKYRIHASWRFLGR